MLLLILILKPPILMFSMFLYFLTVLTMPLNASMSSSQNYPNKMTPFLRQKLAQSPTSTTTVIIRMRQGTPPILNHPNLEKHRYPSGLEHSTALATALGTHAQNTQTKLCAHLESIIAKKTARNPNCDFHYKPMWISNKVVVHNADLAAIEEIASAHHNDIEEMDEDRVLTLNPIVSADPEQHTAIQGGSGGTSNIKDWGISHIKADQVWAQGNRGQGVRVATIDTGVNFHHVALKDNYVKDGYGWFDAVNATTVPFDDNGHGTHTMGTLAGKLGIGVAPNVEWMACKGCDIKGSCKESTLSACLQYILCPTRTPTGTTPSDKNSTRKIGYFSDTHHDCSKAPSVLSCSWGETVSPKGPHYNELLALYKAGIITVFSIGNDGPACETTNDPGSYNIVIGVGAINKARQLANFSSCGNITMSETSSSFSTIPKGNNKIKQIKPDCVAPGVSILSASYLNNTTYRTLSGTSMACPHVSGVVALMRSKNPDVTFEQVRGIIFDTAVRKSMNWNPASIGNNGSSSDNGNGKDLFNLNTNPVCKCAKHTVSKNEAMYPNNCEGWGEIDALKCVTYTPKHTTGKANSLD